ncbi:hypothetical protein [Oceanobacillus chungangensis]|uniref:Uncharacterized protein n=1 Tax=Oceanobacillus chungangensis TaxID=1229152 RepID=A0A3D8PHT5_9BACI|nr:hypothetical protein [Oceanobacillus chungangensis]RDW15640.1 hypothetical protein CWR45_17865 [Oceanobacillus chungangensis]
MRLRIASAQEGSPAPSGKRSVFLERLAREQFPSPVSYLLISIAENLTKRLERKAEDSLKVKQHYLIEFILSKLSSYKNTNYKKSYSRGNQHRT